MKLVDDAPADDGDMTSDFIFDSRTDFEDDFDDFLTSLFCLKRDFSLFTR